MTFSSTLIYTQNKYSLIKVQCHIFYRRSSFTIYLCGILTTYNNHLACLTLWYVGSSLTLLCSEVIMREQPEVPEFIKTLTEPYSVSFSTFPFQRPNTLKASFFFYFYLSAAATFKAISKIYSQPLLQKTCDLYWQLGLRFLVTRVKKLRNLPWIHLTKGKTTHNPCCRRQLLIIAV